MYKEYTLICIYIYIQTHISILLDRMKLTLSKS